MNYRNHAELEPLIQPMYYSNPEQAEAYEVPNQYWFGSELVVAPITEKTDSIDLLAKTEMWLPEGEWFDFFTGDKYIGGKKQEVYRTLDKYPVFAKLGAIIPMNKFDGDNQLVNRDVLDIHIFPGADGEFVMYQDEGDYNKYQKGHFATTKMALDWNDVPTFTIEGAKGDLKLLPKKRTYNIIFRSLAKKPDIKVTVGGATVNCDVKYDPSTHSASVTVIAKTNENVTAKLMGTDLVYRNADVLDRAFDILMRAQLDYETKTKLWDALKNPNLWNMMVHNPDIEHLINALKEIVNLRNK